MSNSGIPTIEIVILALVAVAILLQVSLVLVMLFVMGKVTKVMKEEITDIRSSVMPLIYDTRELLTSLSPKIESTADDLSVILHGFRAQSASICSVSAELVERVKRQSARFDGMVSGVMDRADRTSTMVTDTVGKPVRQVAGLVASAKAIVETLRSPRTRVRNQYPARSNSTPVSSSVDRAPSAAYPAPSVASTTPPSPEAAPAASVHSGPATPQKRDGQDMSA